MRQEFLAVVVPHTMLQVKAKLQKRFVILVSGALLINNSECCFEKVPRILTQNFVVIGKRELLMPVFYELLISVRKFSNELVVNIDPIKHAIVANNRLFSLNYALHDKTKAHFIDIEIVFFFLGSR
jgi:hypothetical protein